MTPEPIRTTHVNRQPTSLELADAEVDRLTAEVIRLRAKLDEISVMANDEIAGPMLTGEQIRSAIITALKTGPAPSAVRIELGEPNP